MSGPQNILIEMARQSMRLSARYMKPYLHAKSLKTLFVDVGYNTEWLHEYCREEGVCGQLDPSGCASQGWRREREIQVQNDTSATQKTKMVTLDCGFVLEWVKTRHWINARGT